MRGLIINGPNLNMLGLRNKFHYGDLTLDAINQLIMDTYLEIEFDFFQSNIEGHIINLLQNTTDYDFVLINPGAFAHYSIAIRDAFEIIDIPKGVCHLSDISKRETFRQIDLLECLSDVYVTALKEQSYISAIKELIKKISQ